jgi:hypothetical protein
MGLMSHTGTLKQGFLNKWAQSHRKAAYALDVEDACSDMSWP